MKKKNLLLVLPALVVIVLVAGLLVANHKSHAPSDKYGIKRTACDLLDLSAVRGVLNETTTPQTTKKSPTLTDGIATSSCTYKELTATANSASPLAATLTVRTPRTKDTVISNKKSFTTQHGKAQKVDVYDAPGYWDAGKGEFNIFKHDTWYTVSFGSNKAGERNLSQTESFMDLMTTKF